MLTREGYVIANACRNENFPKPVEIGKVMLETFYVGCGDSIAANYVTTVHKRCKASDHILMDMPMNCRYVDLPRIRDK